MLDSDRNLIVIDERGWPKMSGIHDARLTTLSLDFGKRLSFSAAGAAREHTDFVLDGIHMLNIVNLWEGVVLDSVAMWPVISESADAPEKDCSRAWGALLYGRVGPEGEASTIARAKRKYEGSTLVSVSSSYGGELHVLCREVTVNGCRVATV